MDSWRAAAPCRGRQNTFFSEDVRDIIIAKSVCKLCPYKRACLADALLSEADEFGVWGGTTPKERKKLRIYSIGIRTLHEMTTLTAHAS